MPGICNFEPVSFLRLYKIAHWDGDWRPVTDDNRRREECHENPVNTGLIIHSAETILRLFLLMTNNWIIETLAMRLARANDRFAALLHG